MSDEQDAAASPAARPRWRRIPPSALSAISALGGWETVPDSTGDEVPLIRAVSWSKAYWCVEHRVTPDASFTDGWHWQEVIVPETGPSAAPGYTTYIQASTAQSARSQAERHWDFIAEQARGLLAEGLAEIAARQPEGEPVTDAATAEREMAAAAREAKLPTWARAELEALRARVADLEGQLADARRVTDLGPDGTNTVLEPYAEPPTPLMPDSHIRFYAGFNGKERAYISAQLQNVDGVPFLRLRSNDRLAVVPESANVVRLYAQWDRP